MPQDRVSQLGWTVGAHGYVVDRPIAPLADGRHAGHNHVHAATPRPRRAWSIHPATVAAARAPSSVVAFSAATAGHDAHVTDHAPPLVSRSTTRSLACAGAYPVETIAAGLLQGDDGPSLPFRIVRTLGEMETRTAPESEAAASDAPSLADIDNAIATLRASAAANAGRVDDLQDDIDGWMAIGAMIEAHRGQDGWSDRERERMGHVAVHRAIEADIEALKRRPVFTPATRARRARKR